jgi:hypothetical protein
MNAKELQQQMIEIWATDQQIAIANETIVTA